MKTSKAFRTLLLYRIGATLSYQIMMVAVGWHLYEITHSVISLGIGLAISASTVDLHSCWLDWRRKSPTAPFLSSALWANYSARSAHQIHGLCKCLFSNLCSCRPWTGWPHDWLYQPDLDLCPSRRLRPRQPLWGNTDQSAAREILRSTHPFLKKLHGGV